MQSGERPAGGSPLPLSALIYGVQGGGGQDEGSGYRKDMQDSLLTAVGLECSASPEASFSQLLPSPSPHEAADSLSLSFYCRVQGWGGPWTHWYYFWKARSPAKWGRGACGLQAVSHPLSLPLAQSPSSCPRRRGSLGAGDTPGAEAASLALSLVHQGTP